MYGKTHTEEARAKIREANLGGRNAGKNNSQYGIKLRDRMSEEQYLKWIERHRELYQGAGNPKARKVEMIYADTLQTYRRFDCIKDCANHLFEIFPELSKHKFDYVRRIPEAHPPHKKPFKNFFFNIIRPNPDKDNTVSSSKEKM